MKTKLLMGTAALLASTALAAAQAQQPGGMGSDREAPGMSRAISPGTSGSPGTGERGDSGATQRAPSGTDALPSRSQRGTTGLSREERPATRQGGRTTGEAVQQRSQRQRIDPDRAQRRGAQTQQRRPQGATTGAAPDDVERGRSMTRSRPGTGASGAGVRTETGPRAGARGTVQLSPQQRTRIQQQVLARAPRADRVDFAINVGTVVPRHVVVGEVPPVLIDIYPEWRGYDFFVVHEDIIIVDDSRRIVAVVPAGRSSAAVGRLTTTVVDLEPEEVRRVQLVLIERGFLDGEADGVFGPRTREALIMFQRQNGLPATGQITAQTVSSLGLSNQMSVGTGELPSTTGAAGSDVDIQRGPSRRNMDTTGRSGAGGAMNRGSTTGSDVQQRRSGTTGAAPGSIGQQPAAPSDTSGSDMQAPEAAPRSGATRGMGGSSR